MNEQDLMQNPYVQELLAILKENGKDTAGLSAIIGHVGAMEDFVKRAEGQLAEMKAQLETMREMRNHPIKTKLQKAIQALEAKIEAVKERIDRLKTGIIEGCKSAVTAFKEKGVAALDNLASFFRLKKGLQAVKNETIRCADICDKTISDINRFAQEYHRAGRAVKNLARMIVGKSPIDTPKEIGKLARAINAPYRAERACLLNIQSKVNAAISKLENLEGRAAPIRAKAADKKTSLAERINAHKERVRQQEIDKPLPERKPVARGAEL